MTRKKLFFTILILLCASFDSLSAAVIKGRVCDNQNEPLIGATVVISENSLAAMTDENGQFEFAGIKNGKYSLLLSCFTYANQMVSVDLNGLLDLELTMLPSSNELAEVSVTAAARRDTEMSMLSAQKHSLVVQTGVSAQQIKLTQDKDASEVIQRIPGISIIDDRFVMVRGLSQRYNNVWLNNGSVPSSESDSRAFSFEIIPSSQLDNLIIVKSPAPEYPADFSGGFILVNTKDIPTKNSFNVSIGANINDQTHFQNFIYSEGSKTDFLGFDNGSRSFNGGINASLNPIAKDGIDLKSNGFNNNWLTYNKKPILDFSINADASHRWISENGETLSMLAAINYSNSYKSYTNMANALYGAYDKTNDKSNYLRNSTDDQYNHDVKLGAMLNLTYVTSTGGSRFEFKNIFNQLGRNRYTHRVGVNAQSDNEESAEYYYRTRTTYNGQFTGKHFLNENNIDWSAGYAYTNNSTPDRRRYLINDVMEEGKMGLSNANDISREFTKLYEHIASFNANYNRTFALKRASLNLKSGAFGEYRFRDYRTRNFIYNWNNSNNSLPDGFRYFDIPSQLLVDENYGADKLYLIEKVKWSDNYSGRNSLIAGYVGANFAIKDFQVYGGVRYEYNNMELITHTKDYEKSPRSHFYKTNDIFPSVNSSYSLNDKNKLRLSYGKSINRPEFREVSPSVFYDFDLASNVQGNYNLKSAYINNVDLRYEFYPTESELVSVSLFYKNFKDPIEWTYTVTGGTDLTYSYTNAKGADNYGIEVDLRKTLDFIGLHGFSLNFNGALIKSKVNFAAGSKESDRPMQGQSPYIINTGLFYSNKPLKLNCAVLYNRIGKRIIGVGRSLGSSQENSATIPHSYEMPVNSIDLNFSKMFGNHFTVKFAVRNLLSEDVKYEQIDHISIGNSEKEIQQVTRKYNPGRNFNINLTYTF